MSDPTPVPSAPDSSTDAPARNAQAMQGSAKPTQELQAMQGSAKPTQELQAMQGSDKPKDEAQPTRTGKPPRTVTLVGLMGAGKSTVGRRLAKLLGAPFYDADQEIMEAAGCSVADIFEIYGETIFRDLEKRVMMRLLDIPGAVIAAGGGAFMNAVIREKVRTQSVSVWLQADLNVLLERVSMRNVRPLLERGDKRAILQRLMDERYPIYADADLIVDSNIASHEAVVDRVIGALEGYWKQWP